MSPGARKASTVGSKKRRTNKALCINNHADPLSHYCRKLENEQIEYWRNSGLSAHDVFILLRLVKFEDDAPKSIEHVLKREDHVLQPIDVLLFDPLFH